MKGTPSSCLKLKLEKSANHFTDLLFRKVLVFKNSVVNSQYFNNFLEDEFKTIFSQTETQSESFCLFISSSDNCKTTCKKLLK